MTGTKRFWKAPCALLLAMALALPGTIQGSLLDPINALGIGEWKGQVQLLAMRRHYLESGDGLGDGLDAASGTAALTLDWLSPQWRGLRLGAQGISCPQLFEAGSHPNPRGQGWQVLNGDFHLLNHAYLQADLGHWGLAGATLRLGRQPLKADFFQPYYIRQKTQALEGAVLEADLTALAGNPAQLQVGWLRSFSSWSPRDESPRLGFRFETLEDYSGVPEAGDGLFVNLRLQPLYGLELSIYDWLLADWFNVMGARAALGLGPTTLKLHAMLQGDHGSYGDQTGDEIAANLVDLALAFKLGGAALEPGIVLLGGDAGKGDLHLPFRSSLTADPLLIWMPRVFSGGSTTLYCKATGRLGKLSLYGIYARTSTDDAVGGGATDQELNLVVGHPLPAGWNASIKLGYGDRDNQGSPDASTIDTRLFLTWAL
jgi:hypothetical protein